MPPPPLPHDRCTHARARGHAQTHTRAQWPARALAPAHAAAREPRRQKAPLGPRRWGWRPRGPAAREPAAGRLCWGCSPPSGALGKQLPAARNLLTPWGSRCYNTHLQGHWNVSGCNPKWPPRDRAPPSPWTLAALGWVLQS